MRIGIVEFIRRVTLKENACGSPPVLKPSITCVELLPISEKNLFTVTDAQDTPRLRTGTVEKYAEGVG